MISSHTLSGSPGILCKSVSPHVNMVIRVGHVSHSEIMNKICGNLFVGHFL